MVHIYSIHRDPALWTHPELFLPDRFVVNGEIKTPEFFVPFSGGRRSCIGEQLGRKELFLLFANLIQTFRVSLPAGADLPSLDLMQGAVLYPRPFKVVLSERWVAWLRPHTQNKEIWGADGDTFHSAAAYAPNQTAHHSVAVMNGRLIDWLRLAGFLGFFGISFPAFFQPSSHPHLENFWHWRFFTSKFLIIIGGCCDLWTTHELLSSQVLSPRFWREMRSCFFFLSQHLLLYWTILFHGFIATGWGIVFESTGSYVDALAVGGWRPRFTKVHPSIDWLIDRSIDWLDGWIDWLIDR